MEGDDDDGFTWKASAASVDNLTWRGDDDDDGTAAAVILPFWRRALRGL
jgi:hypothetical protein